jgi:predicted AlkP superfamily phosphohydrolase/phosphomutase
MSKRGALISFLQKLVLSLADVDWSRTTAYSRGNYGQIFINLEGREPYGIVKPGEEYDRVCGNIASALRAIRDPEDGTLVVDEVFTRASLYSGPYVEFAPDLSYILADGYKALGTMDFTTNRVVQDTFGNSGDHRMNGMICMMGGPTRRHVTLDVCSIMDVMPSVLYLMGLPIPDHVEGRVITEAFEPGYLEQNEIDVSRTSVSAIGREQVAYTDEEIEDLQQRLRNLGYIG